MLFAIKVENKKTYKGPGEYVGRPHILGNPFPMHDESQRANVITKYRQWLFKHMNEPIYQYHLQRLLELARKGPLTLICWCAPKACHADVIKACLEWMDTKE
jgi:hypothetical protein